MDNNKKPCCTAGSSVNKKSSINKIVARIFHQVKYLVVRILLKHYTRSYRLTECLFLLNLLGIKGEEALANLRQLQGGAR